MSRLRSVWPKRDCSRVGGRRFPLAGRGVLVFAAVSCLVVGCQSARYVLKEGDRGVVAIPRDTNAWPSRHRQRAEELMAQHFPSGYVIEREEEHVIGTRSHHNTSGGGPALMFNRHVGMSVGSYSGTIETVDQTEWRIHYRRAGGTISAHHEQAAETEPSRNAE